MKNKIALITGGNAGIGKATAIGLAKKGIQVIIACRNEAKGQEAVKEIQQKSGNQAISLILCDLTSFDSIKNCAANFQQQHETLDLLINNAGMIASTAETTKEGYEIQFGINHMGHFLLTHLLLPNLQKSTAPRVINVSSAAHMSGKLALHTVKGLQSDYSAIKFYAQSKLANILFTKGLVKHYPNIISHALHPGVVSTGFGSKKLPWFFRLIWSAMKPFLVTPEKGAKTSIFLATSETVKNPNGQYYNDKQILTTPAAPAQDENLVDELWTFSMNEIDPFLTKN